MYEERDPEPQRVSPPLTILIINNINTSLCRTNISSQKLTKAEGEQRLEDTLRLTEKCVKGTN